MKNLWHWIQKNVLYIAWIQALIGTMASLYYSEILKLAPCILCWYQRIFLYPMVIILAVGISRKDKNVPHYVLPMSIAGTIIAFYHYLLQLGIIPESLAPCAAGISCTTKTIEYLGFVTIPFLSFVAFVIITACMVIAKKVRD